MDHNNLPPVPIVDEETQKARAAAARAYALADATPGSPQPPVAAATPDSPPPTGIDADYALFVKGLADDDFLQSLLPEEDEEFDLTQFDEEDEDDDDDVDYLLDDAPASPVTTATLASSPASTPGMENLDSELTTLQAELGSLLEEDLEAAVSTLLMGHVPDTTAPTLSSPPRTPLRQAAARKQNTVITASQKKRLQKILHQHYQLLLQQAVVTVRVAHVQRLSAYKGNHMSLESPDELAEILDGAVGMLQDLDQNRKDAIRTSIQLESSSPPTDGARSLDFTNETPAATTGRLTRAAFMARMQSDFGGGETCFAIQGLQNLKATFSSLDGTSKVVESSSAEAVCRRVLADSGAKVIASFLPKGTEVSELLSQPTEVFGEDFVKPCTKEQVASLRRDRNQFTAAEDSLVFRGVNLYGEKQWMLIADRYLPDRSINIISQRYSKLSLLLFKAHGIVVDGDGNLIVPPKLESFEKHHEEALSALKKVEPPAILNVHRWSIEEDLTILKAVPIVGHMWAELSTRLLPHRDRGHLRKRYQVLERRVKATANRAQREGPRLGTFKPPKSTYTAAARASGAGGGRQPSLAFLKKRGTAGGGKDNGTGGPPPRYPPAPAAAQRGGRTGADPANEYRPPPEEPGVAGQFDDSERDHSRLGFERLLSESNAEWSQLARVKQMMQEEEDEENSESAIAKTLVGSLARGAHAADSSGLSMLADKATPPKERIAIARGSIMAAVMERTKRGEGPSTPSRSVDSGCFSPSRFSPSASVKSPPASASKADFASPGFGASHMWNSAEEGSQDSQYPNVESRQAYTPSKFYPPPALGGSEFDAISALNSLSNSPAKFEEKPRSRPGSGRKDTSGLKRSLFDDVVKGADSKKKARK